MAERERGDWRGMPAWRVATGDLWVVVCPGWGGKVVSVFHVPTRRECLAPAPLRPPRTPTYGSLWRSYDLFGWDDAFPTMGECAYPGPGRLAGVRLPDHGEVWSRPWDDESAADSADVVLAIRGMALPYLLRKRLSVDGSAVTLAYELVNEGDEPMPYQYAAFPLWPRGAVLSGPGWAAISGVRLSWDPAALPWYQSIRAEGYVATSPMTADGPDLESAVVAGKALVVEPGATARWTLTAAISTGAPPVEII